MRSCLLVLLTLSVMQIGFSDERWVQIGDRRMNLNCEGSPRPGGPIIVLESGLGSDSTQWRLVQPGLAEIAQVCSYDRAGLGKSDKSNAMADGARMVADLRATLTRAGLRSPLVVVGQSFGGLVARLYARKYPRDVVGMVLVDSYNENEGLRLIELFKEVHGRTPAAEETQMIVRENLDFAGITAQARRENWRRDIPLIVLTRGAPQQAPREEFAKRFESVRLELQKELAARSKQSEQRVIAGAGHNIQFDQPEAVIKAVRDVLSRTKANGR